ncbi:TapB family protein [Dyadobacter sandarakinus]|uniref:DUF3108 domain-containing protein n=1 Tax=Dyadobacter sandarakinus TaxID=2747268 RepID=A0ABX7I4Q1_9BACT|nr:hypothetical protein [Dyadobacter sandarakinus]QRR01081.1 hypothetical protein HWI92_09275 [Dyadobacter sandarakinus]
MKNRLMTLMFCMLVSAVNVFAQTCAGIAMKEGSGFEMDTFDGKGKLSGHIVYKVTKVEKEAAGLALTLAMEVMDQKGKSVMKNDYQMHCNGNTVSIDASSLISEEQLKSFKNMEMRYTSENIEIPSDLTVGQKLKDASLKGEGNSSSIPVKFNMQLRNRNVAALEKVTVPAGTYDAYRINSDMHMEMMMGFPVKMEMQSISYRAPGVLWDVKNETYRKGKLVASSQLTKIF